MLSSNKLVINSSGKTKVLTTRIKYLLDNKIDKDNILAFTFTKKAAKEMKDRLEDYRFDNVYTFHSYCYQYIINNPRLFGFNRDEIYVIDDKYKEIFMNNILIDMNIRKSVKVLLQYVSKRKNGIDVTFEDSKEESLFNTIYYRYEEYLRNTGNIDFDDMVPLFLKYFDKLPFKYEILNNSKYILVDECQDTNQLQYELVKKLSQTHQNIFMVGDDKQLIYSFRSSDIKIIQDYRDTCDEVIPLKQNYRSASNILEVANRLISNNTFIYKNDIYSLIPPSYEVKKQIYESTIEEANTVAYIIDRLIKKGIAPKDIAILYRNNYQSAQLERALLSKKIPYFVYGKSPFYKTIECERIIATYRFINNPSDYNLFFITLPYFEDDTALHFNKDFIKSKMNILDYAKEYNNEIIKNIALGLIELRDIKYCLTKKDVFDTIVEVLFQNNVNEKQAPNIKLLRDLIVSSELSNECEIINEMLLDEEPKEKVVGVRLMTIHKAKGLEFKCVFLVSLNDGILPQTTATSEALEEERRICYVAITRAKEFLHISSADYHYISGIRKKLRPSVFMGEIKILENVKPIV